MVGATLGVLPEPCLSPCPTERPLHYSEKVLPILHGLGTDSYLVVKKQLAMENMLIYLGEEPGAGILAGRVVGWDGNGDVDGMEMRLEMEMVWGMGKRL